MNVFETVKAELNKAAKARGTVEDRITCSKVLNETAQFLSTNQLVKGGGVGLESFASAPELNGQIQIMRDVSVTRIEEYVTACGVKPNKRAQVCLEVARILQNQSPAEFFDASRPQGALENLLPLENVVGARASNMYIADARAALEAFGVNIDQVQVDSRLNIALTVLRSFTNLLDRVLARIPEETNTVIVKIPAPEVYDLEKSQNAKAAVRNGNHRIPLVDLFRVPDAVNTAPKLVVPLAVNDDATVPRLFNSTTALNCGLDAELSDLAMDSNRIGYSNYDFTDLLSEGGKMKTLYLRATKIADNSTEIFSVPVKWAAGSAYTMPANVQDSGDRQASGSVITSVLKDTKKIDDNATTFFATYDDVTISLNVNYNSSVNLKTASIRGSGTVTATLVSNVANTPVPDAIKTNFAGYRWDLVAYEPELYWSEENLRKTTTAVRLNTKQQTFEIPVGRTTVVDFSLQQQTPEEVLQLVNSTINLGNSARGLATIEGRMLEVYDRIEFETKNSVLNFNGGVANEFAAGTLVKPMIIKGTLEFDPAELAVMRESERPTELHSKLRYYILSVVAALDQKSLYQVARDPGEPAVYKIITSSVLADLLFGILDYHNTFTDVEKAPPGIDYSMKLPNGARLDIVKTTFKDYRNKIIMFPVRENDPEHVTSFGTIRDRGTFVGQYTPVSNGAVNKRVVTNAREIVFVTNPVGAVIEVTGLNTQVTLFDVDLAA